MASFLSASGKFLKSVFISIMDALSTALNAVEHFLETNQVGEKVKTIAEQSKEKVKAGMENVRVVQETKKSQIDSSTVNINRLGQFLDGWTELVEDMGDKADEVRSDALERLKLKEMPETSLKGQVAHNGKWSEKRDYVFIRTYPGATTAIYIGKHGKDLYVSWRTWLAAQLNGFLIVILLGIAVLGGYLTFGTRQVSGGFFNPYSYTETWVFGWAASSIVILLLEVWLVSFAGRVVKGNPYAFFFIEPNVFDAEDISAMSLSAHKTILRSLDNAGIDTSKLRIKEKFTGGRRGEDI